MASNITNPTTLSVDRPSTTQTSSENSTAIHMDEEVCTCGDDDMDEEVCTCTEEEIKERKDYEITLLKERVRHLNKELDRTIERLRKSRKQVAQLRKTHEYQVPPEEQNRQKQLRRLRQTGSVEDYIARFQQITYKSGYSDTGLIDSCFPGMKGRIKSEMGMWPPPRTFATFVGMAIDTEWHQNMRRHEWELEKQRQFALSSGTKQT